MGGGRHVRHWCGVHRWDTPRGTLSTEPPTTPPSERPCTQLTTGSSGARWRCNHECVLACCGRPRAQTRRPHGRACVGPVVAPWLPCRHAYCRHGAMTPWGNSLFRHDASTPANLAVLCGSKCRTRLLRCQLLLEHDVFASSKTAPTTLRRTLRDAHYHKESSAPLYVQMSLIRHATR